MKCLFDFSLEQKLPHDKWELSQGVKKGKYISGLNISQKRRA